MTSEMVGMNISREVAMITPLSGLEPRFLMYMLASPSGQRILTGHVKGVAQSGINLSDIRNLKVPLPPTPEQREIIGRVDGRLGEIDRIATQLESARSSAKALESSVLAQAFQGELVEQDPNDEPATVLLDRIQAARETAKPERNRSRMRSAH